MKCEVFKIRWNSISCCTLSHLNRVKFLSSTLICIPMQLIHFPLWLSYLLTLNQLSLSPWLPHPFLSIWLLIPGLLPAFGSFCIFLYHSLVQISDFFLPTTQIIDIAKGHFTQLTKANTWSNKLWFGGPGTHVQSEMSNSGSLNSLYCFLQQRKTDISSECFLFPNSCGKRNQTLWIQLKQPQR